MLFSPLIVTAQITITEIKLKPDSDFQKDKNATIIYPVISTNNKVVDDKINFTILKELTLDDSATDITKTLISGMNTTLSELDYSLTLKGKDIISLTLSGMGCGAYCSSWKLYFNFDLLTGDLIKIEEVISKSELESFRNMVLKDKLKALQEYKKELDSSLAVKSMDAVDIKAAKDYIDEHCVEQVNIKMFSLSPEGLEIMDNCEFPHFMRNMQPVYHLKYSYKQLGRLINPGFTKKLKVVL